jgi:hypothetical protein
MCAYLEKKNNAQIIFDPPQTGQSSRNVTGSNSMVVILRKQYPPMHQSHGVKMLTFGCSVIPIMQGLGFYHN